MNVKLIAAACTLAASFAIASVAAPAPQNEQNGRNGAPQVKKRQLEKKKEPTWEECYAMSRQRGFDHDIEEWLQSIKDCQEGKIPL
jgi:hypothetical protein